MFSSEFKFYLLLPLPLVLAFFRPAWGRTFFDRTEAAFCRLANRPWRCVALVGLVAFVASAAPSLVRLPAPKIHDEFCYLLAADTFAHGRLTNPTHPLWQHFESMYLIQQPTYNAKYPPGQGALVALGQILGHPILGVWLGLAAAGAAVCWMLQAWLPARWALLGGLLMALHPLTLTWGYNYWGGAVATIGGALVGRGIRTIADTRRDGGWCLGAGLFFLAHSRPYEGLIVSVFAIASTMFLIARMGWAECRKTLRHCGLPLLIGSILTVSSIGIYNYRVTGSPLQMPYFVHVKQYEVVPFFIGQSFRPEPEYRHRELREFHTQTQVDLLGSRNGVASRLLQKFYAQAQGWLWMGLWLPPLLPLPWLLKGNRWLQVAVFCLGGLLAGLLWAVGIFPHYAAPGAALLVFVVVQGLRRLRLCRRERGTGLAFARWLCVLCLATVPAVWSRLLAKNAEGWFRDRERVAAQLEAAPGRHLVFVRYTADHNPNREWVYNAADIDHAKVVWSREMTPPEDQQVLHYFRDRKIWVLEADLPQPQPRPYSPDTAGR